MVRLAAISIALLVVAAPAFAADILIKDAKSQPESLAHAPDGTLIVGSASTPYVYKLKPEGWVVLTVRWGVFFLFLAVLNEAVWRNTSEANWVKFKVFGILPLIFLFALAQTPLVLKHQTPTDKKPGNTQD